MDEPFDIPVHFEGQHLLFPAQLVQLGYTHAFLVNINGQEVRFEPDEEKSYRAIITSEDGTASKTISVELLKSIADAIETVLK